MKGFLLYAAVSVAAVALAAWLMAVGFRGPGDAQAIVLSAAIAIVVQLATFGIAKAVGPSRPFLGRGVGAMVRLLTLVVYALLAVKVLALPATAALLSMAVFFFLTTLIEPLLLKV